MATFSFPRYRVLLKGDWQALVLPGLLAAALAFSALYLAVTRSAGFVGYPLDDSWIHQVYARNIGVRGEFSFVPGVPSAGSTAPLWSLALALGHALSVEPRLWSYGLGVLALAVTGLLAYRHGQAWLGERGPGWPVWLALLVVAEWHLIWAAVSGMETLVFAALALATLVLSPRRPALLGLVTALAIATRPDGLTLIPFVALRVWLAQTGGPRAAVRPLLVYLAVLATGLAPYFALNLAINGSWLPNTLAAKDMKLAVLREMPLLSRMFWLCSGRGSCEPGVLAQPWVGGQILLVPGLVAYVWRRVQRREWLHLLPVAWAFAFLLAFTLRSPIIFQHGRYQMPAIPVLLLAAALGLAEVVLLDSPRMVPRVLSRFWAAAVTVSILAFTLIGAGAYMRDVAFIETEMVAASLWIREHTPTDAIIGANDIGALGYFSERRVRDMAGLVDPEIIPFLNDEARLAQWLDETGVDYVMTFPDFFPEIVAQHADDMIYTSPYDYSLAIGYDRTLILRWGPGETP